VAVKRHEWVALAIMMLTLIGLFAYGILVLFLSGP